MKKTLLTFAAIIVGLFLLLSLLDRSNYRIEKRLFRIEKELAKIAKDPKVVPAQKFEQVVKDYHKVAKKYPNSSLTPRIYLQIGMVYSIQKDYAKARAAFEDVIKRYPENHPLAAAALYSISLTHAEEKQPEKVLKIYDQILQLYPLTQVGLNAPLYKANYLFVLKRNEEAQQALDQATTFYKKIQQDHPQTPLEFIALRFLFNTYMGKKDWVQVINTLEQILLNFSGPQYMDGRRAEILVKTINTISVAQLKDYQRPIGIYNKFIKQHPEHPLSGDLKKIITTLQKYEKEGVALKPKNR